MSFMITAVSLMVIGGATTAYGQYAQGQAQKKMYKYQTDVANRQAEMVKQAADTNVQLTQIKASKDTAALFRKYAVVEGAQKAAFGASVGGGSVSEGDVATDTFDTRKIDENMIRYNADLRTWDIRNNAAGQIWGLGTQANQYTFAGKSAARAGAISATGTIFSTAGLIVGLGALSAGGGGGATRSAFPESTLG